MGVPPTTMTGVISEYIDGILNDVNHTVRNLFGLPDRIGIFQMFIPPKHCC